MKQAPKVIDADQDAALRLNLRHLRALSAVAAAGSIGKVAERLYRVASAITRSIAELESSLGRPLFERSSRGIVPNACGELVPVRARRIEAEFDAVRSQLVAHGCIGASVDVQSHLSELANPPLRARASGGDAKPRQQPHQRAGLLVQ